MKTYTQTLLRYKTHTPVHRRRSDKPGDKRRCPRDVEDKGKHLGTSDEW